MILQRGGTRLLDAFAGDSRRSILWASSLAVLAFAVYHVSFPEPSPFDHYVRLADALLHGRIDLVDPPPYLEATTFQGRQYMIPPPFPAILMLPYVAVAAAYWTRLPTILTLAFFLPATAPHWAPAGVRRRRCSS